MVNELSDVIVTSTCSYTPGPFYVNCWLNDIQTSSCGVVSIYLSEAKPAVSVKTFICWAVCNLYTFTKSYPGTDWSLLVLSLRKELNLEWPHILSKSRIKMSYQILAWFPMLEVDCHGRRIIISILNYHRNNTFTWNWITGRTCNAWVKVCTPRVLLVTTCLEALYIHMVRIAFILNLTLLLHFFSCASKFTYRMVCLFYRDRLNETQLKLGIWAHPSWGKKLGLGSDLCSCPDALLPDAFDHIIDTVSGSVPLPEISPCIKRPLGRLYVGAHPQMVGSACIFTARHTAEVFGK